MEFFKRKGKEIVVAKDMYLNEEINMAFDELDINMIEVNFDHIVDRLIEDIDNLTEKQYLEKYKTNNLRLHRLSIMK